MNTALPRTAVPSGGPSKLPGKTVKLKTFLQSKGTLSSPAKRKSLQQLQPLATDRDKLVGQDGFVRSQKPRTPKRKRDGDSEKPSKKQAKFITKPSKKFSIFQEENLPVKPEKNKKQPKEKTPEQIAHELMVQEDVPEKYWEELAEERRVALEQTLVENEQLHHEVAELKEENAKLKVTADQAVYLAEVVQDLLGEGKDNDESAQLDDGPKATESDSCEELPENEEGESRLASEDEAYREKVSDRNALNDRLSSGQDMKGDKLYVESYELEDKRVPSLESAESAVSDSEEDKENTETESDENDESR